MVVSSFSKKNISPAPKQTMPQLGLVCITVSQAVRFKTVTRKRLQQMSISEQSQKLRSLYKENLQRLNGAIDFCNDRDIRLYRVVSNLFPFADTALGKDILNELAEPLRQVGTRARALGIRLVLHPDQFVVLNSDNPQVIENSITILTAQAHLFDLMGLAQSAWAAINIHGGKGDRAERLIQTIGNLPESIRSRLTLENDEYTYGAAAILDICRAAGVAMVFDAHHHLVRESLTNYDHPSVARILAKARTTWPDPNWQLVHISNGRESLHDPRHSDLISVMPDSFWQAPWIEVEAKHKEEAIAKLQQEWLSSGEL